MTDFHEQAARIAQKHSADDRVWGQQRATYAAGGPSLFWLALRLTALTIITFGIYRFWMATKLRRHYWSSIRLGGDPFEYTGTGLEKFLGFLIALVILAVYLGIVNLGLAFAGLFSIDDPVQLQIMLQLSLVAVLPLIYFAIYRARRYIMARTRWRGIRFGMDNGAWGYAWRAVVLSLLTLVTLGLLYPYQHFMLEKYKWDRSWFGSLQFRQAGSWKALFGYWVWFYVIGALVIITFAAAFANPQSTTALTVATAIAMFGYLAVFLVGIRYQVASFRYLWGNRTLGKTTFRNDIDTGEVIGIYIGGSMAVGALTLLSTMALIGVVVGVFLAAGFDANFGNFDTDALDVSGPASILTQLPMIVTVVVAYVSLIGFAVAYNQIFLIRPIVKRKAEGMEVENMAAAATSQQRAHDDAAEAGGFADALGVDVGAGF
ncbi:MAG: DUF898 family protein [Pseudomonadota bacterium]